MVQTAWNSLPKELEDIRVEKSEGFLEIQVPESLTGSEIRFFPLAKEVIIDKAPQVMETKDSGARIHKVKANPKFQDKELSGVLSSEEQSFQFNTPFSVAPVIEEQASFATILWTAASAFLGGLILNLMPCVFPVLSLKVIGIVEQSHSEGRPAWHHGAVFTLGVLASFWVMSGALLLIRAAGQGVGWGYHLQNPFMIAGLAVLFLLIGLNLFGVFEIGENLTQLSGVAEKKEGFAHSFWSGVLTTLAATPCTAPFMGGAVGFALAQPSWVALVIFSSLALGVAAPYMTLTLFPALLEKLPRPGNWMVTFKQILAFPMLVAVVWLTWVFGGQMGTDKMALFLLALVGFSFAAWVYGKWASSFDSGVKVKGTIAAVLCAALATYTTYFAATPTLGEELWQDFSPQLVTELKAQGKPFFLGLHRRLVHLVQRATSLLLFRDPRFWRNSKNSM